MGGLVEVFSLSESAAFSASSAADLEVSADDWLIGRTGTIGRRGDAATILLKSSFLIALSLVGGSFSSSSDESAFLFGAAKAGVTFRSLLKRMWSRGGVGGRKMVCSQGESPKLLSPSSTFRRSSSRAGVGLGNCRGGGVCSRIECRFLRVSVDVEALLLRLEIIGSSRDTLLGRPVDS